VGSLGLIFLSVFFYRLCSDVIEVPTLRQRIAESPAELEQLVRLLVSRIGGEQAVELLARYSALLYGRLGTYAEVAKRTGLDPRTSRKYVESAGSGRPGQAKDQGRGIP